MEIFELKDIINCLGDIKEKYKGKNFPEIKKAKDHNNYDDLVIDFTKEEDDNDEDDETYKTDGEILNVNPINENVGFNNCPLNKNRFVLSVHSKKENDNSSKSENSNDLNLKSYVRVRDTKTYDKNTGENNYVDIEVDYLYDRYSDGYYKKYLVILANNYDDISCFYLEKCDNDTILKYIFYYFNVRYYIKSDSIIRIKNLRLYANIVNNSFIITGWDGDTYNAQVDTVYNIVSANNIAAFQEEKALDIISSNSSNYRLTDEDRAIRRRTKTSFIINNPEIVNWREVCQYKKMHEDLIEKLENNFDKDCWRMITICQKLSEAFMEKHKNNFDEDCWYNISRYQKLSENFIDTYKHKLCWGDLFSYQKMSEKFIEDHLNCTEFFDLEYMCESQKLSEDFIRKYKDRFVISSWDNISRYQKLSEDFIREFKDKLNWYNIFTYQSLSEEFILEFKDKVIKNNYWELIAKCQPKISTAFIRRNCNVFSCALSDELRKRECI